MNKIRLTDFKKIKMKKKIFVGDNLRRIRNLRDIKQEAMGSRLGVPQTVYSSIEQGRKSITLSQLENLANFLTVPSESLLSSCNLILLKDSDVILGKEEYDAVEKAHALHIESLRKENEFLKQIVNNLMGNVKDRRSSGD